MRSDSSLRWALVVDDEALVRAVAVDLLQDGGYQTLEAASGPEALAILGLHPDIGMLLTDINMPGHPDGLGLANEARSICPGIHIVVTSGRVSPSRDEMPARSQFIGKPYTGDQLLSAIQTAARAV